MAGRGRIGRSRVIESFHLRENVADSGALTGAGIEIRFTDFLSVDSRVAFSGGGRQAWFYGPIPAPGIPSADGPFAAASLAGGHTVVADTSLKFDLWRFGRFSPFLTLGGGVFSPRAIVSEAFLQVGGAANLGDFFSGSAGLSHGFVLGGVGTHVGVGRNWGIRVDVRARTMQPGPSGSQIHLDVAFGPYLSF